MAFNSSLSGMKAANADLNVTSHNISNVGTTGFKESRAEFAEVFSSTGYGLLKNGIGAGVRLSGVAQQFSQGDINQTGRYLIWRWIAKASSPSATTAPPCIRAPATSSAIPTAT